MGLFSAGFWSQMLMVTAAISCPITCCFQPWLAPQKAATSPAPQQPATKTETSAMDDGVQETVQLDGTTVERSRFEALLNQLHVDEQPSLSAPLVEPDGGPGGTEAVYAARNPETGERFELFVYESPSPDGGHYVLRNLERRPVELLRWEVSQGLWGRETLVVRVDGTASYEFISVEPNQRVREHLTGTLPAAERAALEEVLAKQGHELCGLRPGRPGIPDEGRPVLTFFQERRRCTTELWDEEWRDRPAAAACARAVQRAIAVLRRR